MRWSCRPRPFSLSDGRGAGTTCGTLRAPSCATTPRRRRGVRRRRPGRLYEIYSPIHVLSRPSLPSRGACSATVGRTSPFPLVLVFVVPSSARPSIGPVAATAPGPSTGKAPFRPFSGPVLFYHNTSRTRSRRLSTNLAIASYTKHVVARVSSGGSRRTPRNTRRAQLHFRKARPAFRLSHSWMHLWQSKAPRKCKALRCNPALTSPVHVTHAFATNLCTIRATTRSMPRMKDTVLNQASNAFAFSRCSHLFSTLRRAELL